MIKMIVGKDIKDRSRTQYYLTELTDYDGFDQVISEVIKHGPLLVNLINGIYSRTASFDVDGKKFKVVYHEDVGVYSYTEAEAEDETWLQEILKKVVDGLNAKV
jgi:hypothetical protein